MNEQSQKLTDYISRALGAWEFTHGLVDPESRDRGVVALAASLAARPDDLGGPLRTMAVATETARCAFLLAMEMQVETGVSFRCLAATIADILTTDRDVLESRHDECVEDHAVLCCPCSGQEEVR